MADRKAVNRYYPPDFDPQKHKSINKYRNSHPLRERARKLGQGILVIRFEMPYNIWCGGCGKHVGMGVRYNAEKKKVGKYYTTPIYQFKMKCHLCDNYFIIETDPQNCDYKIIEGARRKNQKWDMADNEQVLTEDREVIKKRARDPMYKLEHGVQDGKKLKAVIPTLSQIEDMQDVWKDDYMQNKVLRNKFREEKKSLKAADEKDQALLDKSSLDITLVAESDEDKKLATLMKYSVVESFDAKQKHKRQEIKNRPLFASTMSSATNSKEQTTSPKATSSSNGKKNIQEIHKRLGLHRLKSPTQGGFGDDVELPTKPGKSSLGFVVIKKKRKLENQEAVPSSSSAQNCRQSSGDLSDHVEDLTSNINVCVKNEQSHILNSSNSSTSGDIPASNIKEDNIPHQNSGQNDNPRTSRSISDLSHIDKSTKDQGQEVGKSRVACLEPKNTRSLLLCDYGSSSESD